MDLETLRAHIDRRFDAMDSKLDSHLDRLSRNEADVSWLKGHAKLTITIVLASAGAIISMFFKGLSQ